MSARHERDVQARIHPGRSITGMSAVLLPFTPEEFLADLARNRAAHPDFNIRKVHFFPLGGIDKTAEFAQTFGHVHPAAATA